MQSLATRENFEFTTVKLDKSYMTIKYMAEGCLWYLHASRVSNAKEGYFKIKTIHDEHNCLGV